MGREGGLERRGEDDDDERSREKREGGWEGGKGRKEQGRVVLYA